MPLLRRRLEIARSLRLREKNGVSRKDAKAAKEKLFVFFAFFAAWREIILPALNSSHREGC
jgi:hypothetical protein